MADSHILNLVDPVELSAFVRGLDPSEYGFTLSQFLPNQDREDVEYQFNRVDERREDVASYRAWDVEAEIGSRPGWSRVRGEIPPISKKLPITEEQRVRLEALRGSTQASRQIVDEVFDDAQLLTESLLARIEQARGEALTTGKVTFTADTGFDSNMEIDYTIGGTRPIVTGTALAGTDWTTPATGLPITDMLQWGRDYKAANNGRAAAAILTQEQNIDAALLCDEVTGALNQGGVGIQFPTVTDLNRYLSSKGAPQLVAYDTQVSVAGVATDVIAGDRVWFLPAPNTASFGETTFGMTAEAMDAVEGGFDTLATAPGLYGITTKTFDPIRTWTKVSGVVVPVIKDAGKILQSPTIRP